MFFLFFSEMLFICECSDCLVSFCQLQERRRDVHDIRDVELEQKFMFCDRFRFIISVVHIWCLLSERGAALSSQD